MRISRSRYECRLRQSPKSGQAGSQQREVDSVSKQTQESKVTVALSPLKLEPAAIPDEVVVWGTRLLWYRVEAASVPVFEPLEI